MVASGFDNVPRPGFTKLTGRPIKAARFETVTGVFAELVKKLAFTVFVGFELGHPEISGPEAFN
jgi:hypothetical protein